ncbi:MAG: Trk system potassium transporter TrkA [Ruminococcaceae bacterium]|nr:Trk system potassium transporter TrkA [Oscillospiraceae bacterium]
MNIIVNGCGKIGKTILASLVAEGHNVVAIDNNLEVITEITNIYDVMGVCGNGTDSDILLEAGATNAELMISMTGSDELNMLSCYLAKKLGAQYTIARIRNPEYNDKSLGFMREQLDLSLTLNPELLASVELYNILKLPSAAKVETFSARKFEMVEIKLKPDSPLDGIKIMDLRNKFKAKFLISAVGRGEEAYIPDGNFTLKSGDRICISATSTEIIHFLKELGTQQSPAKKIMILGGGKLAFYLAKKLCEGSNSVTIIEKNHQVCERLCEVLPKATIVNADGTDQEVLLEEGLLSVDAVVSLTGMDEQNILMSAFAQTKGVPKVITKINREALIPMAESWGLDTIISPKMAVSNVVVQYARALENSQGSSVETLYKIMDDKVEVLEFTVKDDFEKSGVTFKDLFLKPNTLVAGIIRNRKIIIPTGDDMFMPKDKVIIFAANQRINKLSDILR